MSDSEKFTDQPGRMLYKLSYRVGKNIDFIIYRSSVTTPFL